MTLEEVDLRDLFGTHNKKLNLLKKAFPDLQIISRGNNLKISGDKQHTQKAKSKVEMMVRFLKSHKELPMHAVQTLLADSNPFHQELIMHNDRSTILYGREGRVIKARTRNQKKMVESIENYDVLFAVGPAGTGKTYTAVALAVRALKNRLVRKIILTRPAVEAGENLGYLPGDLKEKIDPYLRPLYDALDDMIPADKLKQLMDTRIIEVAPLAYMRGRTLDDAFIILDEAQNCTLTQIKMFLTRLGPHAKCIVNGDLSQIDLPRSQRSGLKTALHVLRDVNGIAVVRLEEGDVVRHPLVRDIIIAFQEDSDEQKKEEE